ncbi:LysM peptidoglycan-binding domain-containing protein [Peribacillus loiseleuriae]|uniref:LysM peptidoglycan-binding domain-containing protein n=1 Tax=Peribacillus loiseleuriae TaxID=1679170 RepID=UPI0038276F0E
MDIHVVKSGDTLTRLSQQYSVSTHAIVRANGLENPNILVVGSSLLIPKPYIRYKVQPKDTLSSISTKFGTTVRAIMQASHITNESSMYIGKTLTIPVIYHTVKPGDTFWNIAKKYSTTVQAILQTNHLTNHSLLNIGQTLRIPEAPKLIIDVNGFTNIYGQVGSQQVREVASDLTYISPFGYRIQKDGTLKSIDDEPTIQAALSNHIIPIMVITNFSATEAGTALADTILSNDNLVEKLLTNVITTMRAKGYRGLNIDFENVSPTNLEHYNALLQKAVDRLHPLGYFISSSLAPKTSADQKGLLYESHDYAAHGRILDFVVLMTYEWGYRLGPPQAISPINQIRNVLDYAVTVIPRNKIFLGFQVYARDWLVPHVKGQEAQTFDVQEAFRRAVKYNAEIQYDQATQSPFYRYIDEEGHHHEVWFEDARSAQAKFNLVKEYNLRGISYWVLGYPFPQNWTLLEDNFLIRKL